VCNRERATGGHGTHGKRFLFYPDEEKKRREKEPKREEK